MLNMAAAFHRRPRHQTMPRSPLPRTLLAILPIFGALLAALAAHKAWPIPLSLVAMAVIASSSAVIYWSRPLEKRNPHLATEPSLPAPLPPEVMSELVAAADRPAPPPKSLASTPPPQPELGTVGTRADARINGESYETDLLTGLLGREAFLAHLASKIQRCRAAQQTAILVVCDLDAFGEINRTVGLADANRMLRQVADRVLLPVA